jgi:hypothetical protein
MEIQQDQRVRRDGVLVADVRRPSQEGAARAPRRPAAGDDGIIEVDAELHEQTNPLELPSVYNLVRVKGLPEAAQQGQEMASEFPSHHTVFEDGALVRVLDRYAVLTFDRPLAKAHTIQRHLCGGNLAARR